jgi:hypothetical protein
MSFKSNAKFIDFPSIAVIVLAITIPLVVALAI